MSGGRRGEEEGEGRKGVKGGEGGGGRRVKGGGEKCCVSVCEC